MQLKLGRDENIDLQLGKLYVVSNYKKIGLRVTQCLLSAVEGDTLVGQHSLMLTFPTQLVVKDANGEEKRYEYNELDLGNSLLEKTKEIDNKDTAITVLREAGVQKVQDILFVIVSWTDFISADWDGHNNSLLLRFVDGNKGPWQLYLPNSKQADKCAQIIRERIQSSIVHSVKAQLDNGATVWAAVRRGKNGLFTQLLADGQVPNTPAVEAMLQELENSVKDAVGI